MRKALVETVGRQGTPRIEVIREEPLYEWQDVLVSTSRFALQGRCYPIGDVSCVNVTKPRSRFLASAVCAGLSVGFVVSAFAQSNVQPAISGIAFLIAALALRPQGARSLSIEIGKERLSLCHADPTVIAEIADAISAAKRSVQSAKRESVPETDRVLARAARSGAA